MGHFSLTFERGCAAMSLRALTVDRLGWSSGGWTALSASDDSFRRLQFSITFAGARRTSASRDGVKGVGVVGQTCGFSSSRPWEIPPSLDCAPSLQLRLRSLPQRMRLQADVDQLRQKVALLREELRIKHARCFAFPRAAAPLPSDGWRRRVRGEAAVRIGYPSVWPRGRMWTNVATVVHMAARRRG